MGKKICICGGGSLGHVCAGVLASNKDISVNVFTRKPELWKQTLEIIDCNGKIFSGTLNKISNNPEEVLKDCDIIFLCIPGFAIEEELKKIKPYISANTMVGTIVSSTGFFFFAHNILPTETKLFGFQRTPFIARVKDYGCSAKLLGYKNQVSVATENIKELEEFKKLIEHLWLTPVKLLNSFYEASLTNSNPILHTGRLYSMFHNWDGTPFDHNILFYEEWTDNSSEIIIQMDKEFFNLLKKLPVEKDSIKPLLEYYESNDSQSLTKKLQSIVAFKGLLAPMKKIENGFIPDYNNRYFSEDFPFGLKFIRDLAYENQIEVPVIDKVYNWGIKVLSECK